ncbi:MAG: GNAT family N-acetyltransferase [Longimicrobiales bacterium]|nr:GNAT family N-acetyltransferase [Longimicrobiales bacterium]
MELDVRDNPAESRFEVFAEGERIGLADYRRQPGRISFVHTEVDPEHQGQGVAARLIHDALEEARRRELDVLPYCPFVRAYIEEHPTFLELVPEDVRDRFGLG